MVTTDEMVLVAAKSPMMLRPFTALLPGELSLTQSLKELQKIPPKDAEAARVLQQLDREISGGKYDFLVVMPNGQISKLSPTTALRDIAVPREIRTARGLEKLPTAAFEVQAYAPVGGKIAC